MYSWVASFFNEDSTSNTTLYADQLIAQQTGQQPKEEWTWIELIDDKEENGLIIVQTDESVRAHNLETEDPTPSKRKRPITKRDVLARKTFRRSLHTDRPLMSKPRPSTLRKLAKAGPLDVQLRKFCKVQQTTSEVLSATFPTCNLFNIGTNTQFDCDISYLLNNTTFLKCVLEGILKEEVILDRSLQQWLELLMNVGRKKQIKANQQPLAIEWRKKEEEQLFIEWRSTEETALPAKEGVLIEEIDDIEFEPHVNDDDVIITMVRYPLPSWLRRINTFDNRHELPCHLKHLRAEDFHQACGESNVLPIHTCETLTRIPDHLKQINPEDFHQACGEANVMPIQTCDTLTRVPSWMRRLDVVESRHDKEYASTARIPTWMRQLRVNHEEMGGCYRLPSWMNRINVDIPDSKPTNCDLIQTVRGSNSWFSTTTTTGWVSNTRPRKWIRASSETVILLNNAQTICNSMINFAMVLATATCKAAEKTATDLSLSSPVPNTIQASACAQKKKRVLSQSSLSAKHLATKSAKKNKKWLSKVNNVKKIQNKRNQRYNAKSFSGSKCVRAC